MSFTDRKLEMSILGLSLVLVGGMGYLLKSPVQAVLGDQDEVVYEMPRPKTSILAALFNLGDREISRKYVNPFAKKNEEAKKAEDAKKATAAAAPKALAQKKAVPQKKEDPRKKKVDVQVVGNDATQSHIGDEEYVARGGGSQQQFEDIAKTKAEKNPQQSKNSLSGDQWRALLQAQPTKENMAKLIEAYNNQEVNDQVFYTIVTDLFRNNKSESQSLGMLAVKSVYNAKSFAVTAQYYDQLAPEVQPQAHAYLMSYAVTPRLGILASAMQSNNPAVVETALQVVMEGHKKAKDGVASPADPRYSRGDVTTNSVAGYSKFIPLFQQLAQSSDAAIKDLANTALSQIQTTVAAL